MARVQSDTSGCGLTPGSANISRAPGAAFGDQEVISRDCSRRIVQEVLVGKALEKRDEVAPFIGAERQRGEPGALIRIRRPAACHVLVQHALERGDAADVGASHVARAQSAFGPWAQS